MHLSSGIAISMVFQLAHVVEATHFTDVEQGTSGNEWAVHQIQTTANFATGNKVLSWLAGGLNYQIEHHLFPRISHIHYPAISNIVRQTCDKFNLKYIHYHSMSAAVASHFRLMRKLGTA
jgi:linoleoyl-CoA desaturase